MSEMSSTVENDPPAAPVITTRAKVVRESFTALRSDFEINTPPPVTRPQRQDTAPIARGGGQSNIALSVGGGIVLVGGIFAFLFFGYGSNKGAATPAKPVASGGAASSVVSADAAKHSEKTKPHLAQTEIHDAPHKLMVNPAPEHRAIQVPLHKPLADGAAQRVAIPRTEPRELPREPRPVVHEKLAAVVPTKAATRPDPPVHRVEHVTRTAAPTGGGHDDDSGGPNLLHTLDGH